MLTRRGLGLCAALPALVPRNLLAQPAAWPDRTVRAVVGFGPGGAIDVLARIMAPHFPGVANGQALLVENRGGAGGTIGAGHVAQARPDGYTLLMGELASSALAHELYKDLPYDPRRSFTPIILLAELPMLLAVRPGLPARNLAELLDQAKARPGSLSFGTVGTGHISHLVMEMLQRSAGGGARLLHVVYRSGAEVIAAVIKGEVDMTVSSLSTSMPFVQAGTVRAMAVTTARPQPTLPDIPTMAETVPGAVATLWYGMLGPAGIPAELVAHINATLNATLAVPVVRDAIHRQQAGQIIGGPADHYARHIQAEIDRWTPVVRAAGIKAE